MNIGDVARRSGLPAKTIRYYEDIGLVTPRRDPNGYRAFGEADIHRLAFLARARSLGRNRRSGRENSLPYGRIADEQVSPIFRDLSPTSSGRGTGLSGHGVRFAVRARRQRHRAPC